MADLELYQAEDCPHCARVRGFCTSNGISLTIHNPRTAGTPMSSGRVTAPERYEELQEHGKDQIPLLVDNERGEALYESDDIIAYLGEHYVDGEPARSKAKTTVERMALGLLLFTGALASIDTVVAPSLVDMELGALGLLATIVLLGGRLWRR